MTVGVVGLGLIGGSIGLALRDPSRTIVGCDPSAEAERVAKERFCVDELRPLSEVSQAEVVFVCAPPDALTGVLDEIAGLRGPETVVTDCGSVKAEVVRWSLRTKAKWFVPGHPMAGHEKGGARYASAWMFRDARWILTPTRHTATASVRAVEALVKGMGAKPARVAPDAHDRHVATVSHLPHVVANAVLAVGARAGGAEISGGSWRDLTRVAGADPALWEQILGGNAEAVAAALDELTAELARYRAALNNREELGRMLKEAQAAKEALA